MAFMNAVHMEGSDFLFVWRGIARTVKSWQKRIDDAGVQFKKKKNSTSAALYTALQHFKNLFFGFKRGDKNKKKHKCHIEISLSSFRLGPVLVGAALLLWLLVQLHVGHQDVLLRLLRQAGVGAAVAGALVGPP